jgi:hypothetical protein
MKEGQTYLTTRGTLVKVICIERVGCTTNWVTVWDVKNKLCFYISPDSLRPIE